MKRVLSVGQCAADHGSISSMLNGNFEVTVEKAATADEAMATVRAGGVDLVLVNRLLDLDHSEGSDIIKAIKGDESIASVPVMLVTNFVEHDEAAVKMGAVSGFGKSALSDPATIAKLAEFLS